MYPAFKYDDPGDPDGFIDTDRVQQSAEYAMHYEDAPLVAPTSAYDARFARAEGSDAEKKAAARSPAVDVGSDDAYGYDSTSTNTKEIDMSRPDVGYHYYRRIADDDPIEDPLNPGNPNPDREVKITFKQPKPGKFAIQNYQVSAFLNNTWVNQINIDPDPNHPYVEGELKDFMENERTFQIRVRTRDVNQRESNADQSPQMSIIIDASNPTLE